MYVTIEGNLMKIYSINFKSWLMWGLATSFLFIDILLQDVGNMIVNPIIKDFHITYSQASWLGSAFFWSYFFMQIPVGVLLDRLGTRRVIICALLLVIIGESIFTVAPFFSLAVIGRLIMGFGSSFGFVALLYVISSWFSKEKIHFIFGLGILLALLTSSLFQYVGPIVVASFGWRILFVCILFLSMSLFTAMYFFLEDTAIVNLNVINLKAVKEMLKNVVCIPSIWYAGIFVMGILSIYNIFVYFWAVPFFESAYHLSYIAATNMIAWVLVGTAFGGPILGWINKCTAKPKEIMIVATIVLLVIILSFLFNILISTRMLTVLLFFLGVFGSVTILGHTICALSVPEKYRGFSIAFCNTLGMAGSAVFQPITGYLADLFKKGDNLNVQGYHVIILLLFSLLVLSFLSIFKIKLPAFMKNKN